MRTGVIAGLILALWFAAPARASTEPGDRAAGHRPGLELEVERVAAMGAGVLLGVAAATSLAEGGLVALGGILVGAVLGDWIYDQAPRHLAAEAPPDAADHGDHGDHGSHGHALHGADGAVAAPVGPGRLPAWARP